MKSFLSGCIWFMLLFVLCASQAHATHIVGGEVSYLWLGGNNYQVRLDIYQDCTPGGGGGDPIAIALDNPAIIAIFTGSGTRILVDSIVGAPSILVPSNFSNACINNPPVLCLRKQSFIRTYTLPPNSSGYYVVHQRCCRNRGILNIKDPGSTGGTYYAIIPPRSNEPKANSSAVFRNYPPQIICINNPLFYDHSASDADGDSPSYSFSTAFIGGSGADAKPIPQSINFDAVTYIGGNSATRPMPGNPALQINARTGMITGTPSQAGRFVVTVSCHEWRAGVRINTVTREFQFVVTHCSKAVVANIPQFSDEPNTYKVLCKGFTVYFANTSIGANTAGDAYTWDFGVPGIESDVSHLREPEYTYPDTGTYQVKLIVNRNSTCADSITRLVKVYPEFRSDFSLTGLLCPNSPIRFNNLTTSTFLPVIQHEWLFGDGAASTEEHPVHAYSQGGQYTVRLSGRNIKGCRDTVARQIGIEQFKPFAGNDTIIVKGEQIYFKATGGDVYTWSPATYLNSPFGPNPRGYYPDTVRLDYVVHIASESGCEGNDTINVWVVSQESIFVPSAFTPNGDGRNDILRPIGIGYGTVNYFRIYNRWGQPVFYGTRFNDGWDGNYQGNRSDIGTYYWQLKVTDRFGKELKLKGDATLLR